LHPLLIGAPAEIADLLHLMRGNWLLGVGFGSVLLKVDAGSWDIPSFWNVAGK